jgi:hypothetical protein
MSTGELAHMQGIGRAIDCPLRIDYYKKTYMLDAVRGIHC